MLVHFSVSFLLRIIVSMPHVIQVFDVKYRKARLHFSTLRILILGGLEIQEIERFEKNRRDSKYKGKF